jgi:hypothetical protein
MRHVLNLHPDSRCDAATRIEVYVSRGGGGNLLLHYYAIGTSGLVIAVAAAAPSRSQDDLWRHTCFEAFLRPTEGDGYCEFNFAPSRQWAAYHFDGYRSGKRAVIETDPPSIELRHASEQFELRAHLKLDGLPGVSVDSPLRLGLSAVVEEKNGRLSYWALKHAPGKPDFHHSDCFALELPGTSDP